MNLIKEAFRLKAKGLNNTQIANQLGIRRQDLVVIFKYLREINPQIFNDLEEIDNIKKQLLEELEIAKQKKYEIENEVFILKSTIDNLKHFLKLKENEIKEKQNEIIELNNRLKECLSEKAEYEKEIVNIVKHFDEEKKDFINKIDEMIVEKEEIIEDLENKLKKCKPTRCYIAKTLNFLLLILIFGALAATGYFVFKYKIFDIKKEVVKRIDYNYICYVLGDFKGIGIRDYKYQFCYYEPKKQTKN